jgi:hypothetical protein
MPNRNYGVNRETLLLLSWVSTLDLRAHLQNDQQVRPWNYPQPLFPSDLLEGLISSALVCLEDDPVLEHLVKHRLLLVDLKPGIDAWGFLWSSTAEQLLATEGTFGERTVWHEFLTGEQAIKAARFLLEFTKEEAVNKRQRKKQIKRYYEEEARFLGKLGSFFSDERSKQMRFFFHPRNHWMSRSAFLAKKQAFEKKLQEEKRQIQDKEKTHWRTLGGWIQKIEVQIVDGKIDHKKWCWGDIEMNGPLAFIMQLSCGHHMDRRIDGKSEEELRQEYVGKIIYCDYCR